MLTTTIRVDDRNTCNTVTGMAALFFLSSIAIATTTSLIAIGVAVWNAERCPEGWFHNWIATDPDADDIREERGFDWRGLEHYHLYRLMKCTKCDEERKTLIFDSEPGADVDLPLNLHYIDE